ncbi:MAG TPA: M20/M25/M40 family metallo-hydrolase [Vicinamibacterales bacterium]|nr:M20/M25/M40 family metallo-hydrolase [Vicinamibacterales bacterium]
MKPAVWLLTLACVSCGVHAQTQSTKPPQKYEVLGRQILGELIAIDTTVDRGSTVAAKAVAARAIANGFSQADVTIVTPKERPDSSSVVVRLRGRSRARPILYINHLDVVPAKREDWTFAPFQLTERDGWLYGRGVIDMKGQDTAVLTALIRLKQEGFVPSRDIIAAFTPDEETRSQWGVGWLLKEHRNFVDGALVVNPDGGEAAMKNGRRLYVGVQTSEKTFVTFELETTDKGGHSSRPTADNPIYRLSAALARLSKHRFPLHLTDTTRMYFERRAGLESGQLAADMRGVLQQPPDPAAVDRLSQVVETNIQLRSTCTTTMIDGGHAENALPQRARATVQCRLIPGETQESAAAAIRIALADPKVEIKVKTAAVVGPESKPSRDVLAVVERVTRSMWPGLIVVPYMSPGASDSVYTRGVGIPSYGIDGMFDDLDDARAHGKDERIGVAAFGEDLEFTYRLMRAVSDLN